MRGEMEVEGGVVRYRIIGQGERTLVLLHGGPGASSRYFSPLERLADKRRVVFYDQLGGGASDRPHDPSLWRVERFVEELEALRAHLGLAGFDLLGHSWGGMLAIDYALRYQQNLRSLILASTIADAAMLKEELARLRKSLPFGLQKTLQRHEERGTTDSPEYQEAMRAVYRVHLCRLYPWPQELVRSFDELNMEVYETMWGPGEFFFVGNLSDWSRVDRLDEIRVPTLITVGEYDELTPSCSQQIHRGIRNSELVVFENCSHVAFLENTEAYLRALETFLGSI